MECVSNVLPALRSQESVTNDTMYADNGGKYECCCSMCTMIRKIIAGMKDRWSPVYTRIVLVFFFKIKSKSNFILVSSYLSGYRKYLSTCVPIFTSIQLCELNI